MGLGFGIRDPGSGKNLFRIPDPGVKNAPDPQHWSYLYLLDPGLEEEFLDINLTKDSSLLLHAISSPFYWRNLWKTILFSGFKKSLQKNLRTKKTRVYSLIAFCRAEKRG
jgi:hypothetical protein